MGAPEREDGSWFRDRVYWFTFLLSILVIWVHSLNAELFLGTGEGFRQTDDLERILAESLGQIAVPGFFMVSAYLFYRNFTWERLPSKWKSRLRSIGLPYVLWNGLYYAGYVLATHLPGAAALTGKPPVPVSMGELFEAVVHFKYNPVFWYLYQLILLIVLAPVLFALLKRWWTGAMLLAAILVGLWNNVSLPQLNLDALFYYAAVAFLAVHRESFGGFVERRLRLGEAAALAACLGISWLLLWFLGRPGELLYGLPLHTVLVRFAGVWSLGLLTGVLPLRRAPWWTKNNFFLYAVHFAWVRLFNKVAARLLPPVPASALLLFGFMPFFMVVVSSLIGQVLKAFLPKVYEALSGGR